MNTSTDHLEPTPSRLRFLCGDLGFERKKIAALTNTPFDEIANVLHRHNIRRFRGIYWHMSFRLMCTIGTRLDLRFTTEPFLLPHVQHVLRDAVADGIVSGRLDVGRLDAVIAELPTLVVREGLSDLVAERARRSRGLGGSFSWHRENGEPPFRMPKKEQSGDGITATAV